MEQLSQLIKNANHTIVFTGAGMSTESGLPDFRSKDRGLWEKFNPDELANVNALHNNREEFSNFYRYRLGEIDKYQPHEGHYILGEWEKKGLIHGIITQNVDGFHSDAGNENVMQLHGSFRSLHCHICQQQYERQTYLDGKYICDCGGTIRPGIVLFGESLPEETFRQAEVEANQSDLFIVLGSSLSVTPANMFPLVAKQSGAKLIIVNREATELDSYADFIYQDQSIKELLTIVNNELNN